MSQIDTQSDAVIRQRLREREREQKRLRNEIIIARRQGADPDQIRQIRERIGANRTAGRQLSLENTERRRARQTEAEFTPRDIPDDEIRAAATAAREQGRIAERLSAEQGQQVRRGDQAALADVQNAAQAQRLGLTPPSPASGLSPKSSGGVCSPCGLDCNCPD